MALAGLLSATAALPALAQSGEAPVLLDPIVIQNTEDATGPVGDDPNPLTATGSKVPLNVTAVPQSVTVLGREEIERFEADRVSEALRYTAGVTADVFGDDGDYDWLRIRGFQADQTGIYLDNAQNLAFAFGSFYIDPFTLERIEVLRGPSSALYGGSNPGGIINYVSKRPGEDLTEVSVGVNDAVSGFASIDYGRDLGGGRAFRLYGRIEGGDKYDDLNEGLRGTLGGSFKTTSGAGTEFTVIANLHAADEKHNGSTFLPYFGTVEGTDEFGFIDPDANFSDPDWDSYRRDQATVSAIVEHEFQNGFTLTGIGRLGYASVEERYFFPFGYAGFALEPADDVGTLSLIAFEHDTEVRTAQGDIRYYGKVNTGPIEHNLLFGLDARYYELSETQASGFGTNTVVGTTDPGTPATTVFQDATTTQSQIGLYFQDQLRWQGWIATLNLRQDFVDTEQDGAAGFDRYDTETSYRAALGYEFANGLTPYVSYSSFFNPLIVSPANGVTEPERGAQIEAGVKWAPEGAPFAIAAAVFQIDQENVVTGVFPTFDQLGEVRVQGAEIEGRISLDNGLSLRGTASVLDAEIREDSTAALVGNTPTLVPETEASLFVEYDFVNTALQGLIVGTGVRYRGESFADAENTLKVDSSTIFDAFASYEFPNGVEATAAVTNIADERYVTACQTLFVCSYGSGRELSLTLTQRF
ncbi:MAG: TonB-dependent siderophore receptor [Pseudomonadota bacterium]